MKPRTFSPERPHERPQDEQEFCEYLGLENVPSPKMPESMATDPEMLRQAVTRQAYAIFKRYHWLTTEMGFTPDELLAQLADEIETTIEQAQSVWFNVQSNNGDKPLYDPTYLKVKADQMYGRMEYALGRLVAEELSLTKEVHTDRTVDFLRLKDKLVRGKLNEDELEPDQQQTLAEYEKSDATIEDVAHLHTDGSLPDARSIEEHIKLKRFNERLLEGHFSFAQELTARLNIGLGGRNMQPEAIIEYFHDLQNSDTVPKDNILGWQPGENAKATMNQEKISERWQQVIAELNAYESTPELLVDLSEELREKIEEVVKHGEDLPHLTDLEKLLLCYGPGLQTPLTNEQIAQLSGLTEERIKQILSRVTNKVLFYKLE